MLSDTRLTVAERVEPLVSDPVWFAEEVVLLAFVALLLLEEAV